MMCRRSLELVNALRSYFDLFGTLLLPLQVVVVANPACTNCLMAMRYAPSLNPKNFSALTRLDHDRLKVIRHVIVQSSLCSKRFFYYKNTDL
jgi:hypothetical protein